MSDQHTQGKLISGVSIFRGREAFTAVPADATGKIVALFGFCGANDEAESIANLRRFVACWNMLVGETTEDIEANPLPAMFDQMSAHLAQLQKNVDAILAQRDELVSACKLLIDYCDKHPPMGDSLWSVQLIRAAIKKAEGCAA